MPRTPAIVISRTGQKQAKATTDASMERPKPKTRSASGINATAGPGAGRRSSGPTTRSSARREAERHAAEDRGDGGEREAGERGFEGLPGRQQDAAVAMPAGEGGGDIARTGERVHRQRAGAAACLPQGEQRDRNDGPLHCCSRPNSRWRYSRKRRSSRVLSWLRGRGCPPMRSAMRPGSAPSAMTRSPR